MSNVIQVCAVEQYVEISKLKFHPNNPRTIKADRLDQLKLSITEKGFYQPILVWKKGNIVLAGNHRLLAAQELVNEGWEFEAPNGKKNVLPVVIENVSEKVARQILFETNNTYAEWVEDKLKDALAKAEEAGEKLNAFGFTDEQIDEFMVSAVADAEKATKKIRDDMDEDSELDEFLDKKLAESEEEFESLVLPKSVYKPLKALLGDISSALAPEWEEQHGYKEAVLALVLAADQNNLIKYIQDSLATDAGSTVVMDFNDDSEELEGETMGTKAVKTVKKAAKAVKTSKKAKSVKAKSVKKTK
jgi:ParB-like chromosome segregation protein Spo0J